MIAVLVWRCLIGSAPAYLHEICRPASGISGCRALRSSTTDQILVPRATTSTKQRCAFPIVGLSIWNGLSLDMRLPLRNNANTFYKLLCVRLICIAEAELGALLSRFLEREFYTFFNE